MKISIHITAALLALGIVSQAGADTVVYLTGSSAFRSTVFAALANNGGTNAGGVFDAGSVTWATWGNANAASASYMVFHGTNNSQGIYVDCAWSGSEAGIASACGATLTNQDRNGNNIPLAGSPEAWIDVTNAAVVLTATGTTNSSSPSTNILENNGVATHGADLATADTSQAVSFTPAVPNTATDLKDYGVEGAVTFIWTKNVQTVASNAWLGCTNITIPQINVLLANGAVRADFLTQNTNDTNFTVYLVGRNKGSGTRMNALATSTYGGHNPVQQYSIGGGVQPGETQSSNLVLAYENNNGYEAGGGVAKAMAVTGSCQQADPNFGGVGWYALGYVSPADALNTGNYGGEPVSNWVTVDGVAESNNTIENGCYWFWGHEHLYGKHNIQLDTTKDGIGKLVYQAVKITMGLPAFHYGQNPGDHDPGILGQYMHVGKSSDVAFPTLGNTGNGYP